jgi:hypothetical protein
MALVVFIVIVVVVALLLLGYCLMRMAGDN